MNVVHVNQVLADASIEQITDMALQAEGNTGDPAGAAAGEQDVAKASSGQSEIEQVADATKTESEAKAKPPESDKEVNFAKLRTKAESLDREVQRLAEENKRLAERQYVAELPADHAQKVLEADARLADIGAKFQAGELTWENYQAQLREQSAVRDKLTAAAVKAEISKEMREQEEARTAADASKTWQETVDGFIASKPDALDYTTDDAKRKDLNTYVKALAADEDNSDKPMEWFLTEAHALVKSKHGVSATTAPAKKDVPVVPQVPGAPIHTLSDLPGGSLAEKTEIEQFDQISGAALTNRFAGLSSAEIDKQLAALA